MPKRLTLLLLLTSILIPFAINCGKKAPPLPPIIIAPEAPSHARVRQSGTKLIFMFEMPVLNTDEQTRADIEKIEIYRLKEPRIGMTETAQTQTQPQTQTQTQTQSQPQSQTQIQTQTQIQLQSQTQTQVVITQSQTQTSQTQTQTQTQSQSQSQTQ